MVVIGSIKKELVDSMQKKFGFSTESEVTPLQILSLGANEQASQEIKFVPKGWGYEKWIVNSPEYCGKILFFARGKKCSWHFHVLKDEVFYVHKGAIEVYYSYKDSLEVADKTILIEGDKFHVPRGMRHQMVALKDTELFEFSTQHFDTDSHRIERGD